MKKWGKYLILNILLNLFFLLGKILKRTNLHKVANLIEKLIFLFPWKRKKIALENLNTAFGIEYTEKEKKLILKKSLKEVILTVLEVAFIIKKSEKLSFWAEAKGVENLDEALKEGKGVIALSGHMGNIPVMLAWLAEKGYSVAVLYKEGKYLSRDFLYDLIKSYKIEPIPFRSKEEVPNQIIGALNRGMIVFLLSDQSRPGVNVKFFGRNDQCQKGAFVISKRKSSPIVPIFIVRKGEKHKILIYPQLKWREDLGEKNLSDENLVPLVQQYYTLLENLIRQHPEQYLWFFRRFKKAKTH